MVRSLKSLLIWVVLASFATSVLSQSKCIVEEPHIALGDRFNLEAKESNHFFTIGFTIKGDCETFPEVGLKNLKTGELKRKAHFASKSIGILIPDVNSSIAQYTKQALFFKIDENDFVESSSWAVYHKSNMVVEPVEFPARWRENNEGFRMFVVADMDITNNSKATVSKIAEIDSKDYDFLVHVGDFAYEIETRGGKQGDEFFAQMSHTTRRIPYFITPGNHEMFGEGMLFNYRFRMPNTEPTGLRQNHFYDMVVKGTYFMMVDFDFLYIHREKNPDEILLAWVKERLALLSKRNDISWKVFVSHRPFSCSDWTAGDCYVNMYVLRKYEDLLAKHGFQFMLQGHLHTYTRSKPLRGLDIMPQSKIGSGAMVSIVDGHSGTEHYFGQPEDTGRIMSAIMQTVDSSGPSYTLVEITPDRFQTQLMRADTGESRDTFSIDRSTLDDNFGRKRRWWWAKYLILSVIAVVLGTLVIISYLYQKKQEVKLVNMHLEDEEMFNTYKKVPNNDLKTEISIKNKEDTLSKVSTLDSPSTNMKSPTNLDISPINVQ